MPSLKHQPPHRPRPRAGNKNHARRLDPVSQASCVVSSRRNCCNRQHQTQIKIQNLNRHYDSNQQYSITAVSDGGGTVVERYAYTAYGQVTFADTSGTVQAASASNNRYTYTGREWDQDLSLYHYRARMYDAVGGRFVSRDPIGYEGGHVLYGYSQQSPLNSVDPSGNLSFRPSKPRYSPCGGLVHTAAWKTDKGERNGYIVQKVCYSDIVMPCCAGRANCKSLLGDVACPNKKVCSSQCYLEAWPVRNGIVVGRTDTFAFPNCDKSRGIRTQVGQGIFVPDTERLIPSEGVARACALPSACLETAGVEEYWNEMYGKYGDSSTLRLSITVWNCCDSKWSSHYSVAY